MLKLDIELVPRTAWNQNLRSYLTNSQWDKVRKKCYKKAGYVCEICQGTGPKHPVECHEVWEYTQDFKVKLRGLIALCPSCHEVKHIGLAEQRGNAERAIAHFCRVNNVSEDYAIEYINQAFVLYSNRSLFNWTLDVSYIQEYLKEE